MALRVLLVTPYYAPAYRYGGPTRSVPLLCRGLTSAGVKVTVFTTDANGTDRLDVPLETPQDQDGVDVWYFARDRGSRRFASNSLASACEDAAGDFDLIHISGLWTRPAAFAAAAAKRRAIPYVVSPRGMLMPWEFGHKSWKKRPFFWVQEGPRLRRAAALHCTTRAEAEAVGARLPGARTFIVPNAIDIEEFRMLPVRDLFRRRLGIPTGSPLILFMGRLHEKKGIDLLVTAFLRLRTTEPEAHLVLAGPDEGDNGQRIRAWMQAADATGHVHLPGELVGDRRLQAYRDADVVALLSRSENFGMCVAEAMACRIPVVVTPGVGIHDWVQEWGAGVVTRPDEVDTSAALHAVLEPTVRQEMGDNGRRLVQDVFDVNAVGTQMHTVYHRLLDA